MLEAAPPCVRQSHAQGLEYVSIWQVMKNPSYCKHIRSIHASKVGRYTGILHHTSTVGRYLPYRYTASATMRRSGNSISQMPDHIWRVGIQLCVANTKCCISDLHSALAKIPIQPLHLPTLPIKYIRIHFLNNNYTGIKVWLPY